MYVCIAQVSLLVRACTRVCACVYVCVYIYIYYIHRREPVGKELLGHKDKVTYVCMHACTYIKPAGKPVLVACKEHREHKDKVTYVCMHACTYIKPMYTH
jgi:hypothetical protein